MNKFREAASTVVRNFVRPFTPRIQSQYNGVEVGHHHLTDYLLPAEQPFDENYKENLVEAVCEAVSPGDDVVVGAGYGVTTVHAARESGHGEVIAYECSEKRVENCKDCFSLNDADVNLRKAAVGVVKKKVGNVSEAEFVHPINLPKCDVLELDCEGAEVEILKEMIIQPTTVVVETHAEFESPTEKVKKILSDQGYEVVEERPDAPYTDDNVLTAKYIGDQI